MKHIQILFGSQALDVLTKNLGAIKQHYWQRYLVEVNEENLESVIHKEMLLNSTTLELGFSFDRHR